MITIPALDRKTVSASELDAAFTAIAAATVTNAEISPLNIPGRALRDPKKSLYTEFGYPNSVSFFGNIILESILSHVSTLGGASNKKKDGFPVSNVVCHIRNIRNSILGTGSQWAQLCYSKDGGVTWTSLTSTRRYFGFSTGSSVMIYGSTVFGLDYMGYGGTMTKDNYPFDREITIQASVGDGGDVASAGITTWAVELDAAPIISSSIPALVGIIELRARD